MTEPAVRTTKFTACRAQTPGPAATQDPIYLHNLPELRRVSRILLPARRAEPD